MFTLREKIYENRSEENGDMIIGMVLFFCWFIPCLLINPILNYVFPLLPSDPNDPNVAAGLGWLAIYFAILTGIIIPMVIKKRKMIVRGYLYGAGLLFVVLTLMSFLTPDIIRKII